MTNPNINVTIIFITLQLDSSLQNVLENVSKVNDYDYNKMIGEFELIEVKEGMKKEKVI